mmetsp:Transcript_14694/g.26454  ORF Transcript_14694/g.26454 Transcript_14694/m.26454 type:complete len:380 (+) Transcript_14694:121-1260(+)|eukprot:CAMPEP_0197522488 /NCGR_PEP_ID=MMETSP1318-20131121/7625_1 /TAXON_ID=552666 /ORGANISM="Partenskyella glossopodia, Strain RCC365" /LENGTH=379 /DNA_ID=CAMNT_0043074887 /DNA_START=129 /DNA_END=1265 /DNA_ORIENTATION=+
MSRLANRLNPFFSDGPKWETNSGKKRKRKPPQRFEPVEYLMIEDCLETDEEADSKGNIRLKTRRVKQDKASGMSAGKASGTSAGKYNGSLTGDMLLEIGAKIAQIDYLHLTRMRLEKMLQSFHKTRHLMPPDVIRSETHVHLKSLYDLLVVAFTTATESKIFRLKKSCILFQPRNMEEVFLFSSCMRLKLVWMMKLSSKKTMPHLAGVVSPDLADKETDKDQLNIDRSSPSLPNSMKNIVHSDAPAKIFTKKDFRYDSDMKVTSEKVLIVCSSSCAEWVLVARGTHRKGAWACLTPLKYSTIMVLSKSTNVFLARYIASFLDNAFESYANILLAADLYWVPMEHLKLRTKYKISFSLEDGTVRLSGTRIHVDYNGMISW